MRICRAYHTRHTQTLHRGNANDKLRQMRCSSARVRASTNAFAPVGLVCARAPFLSFPFRVWNGVPIFRHDFIIILKTCLRDARCVCALACCHEIEYRARRHGRPDVEAIPRNLTYNPCRSFRELWIYDANDASVRISWRTHSVLRMNPKF